MTQPATTGPTAPAWIREQIRRHEAEWPLRLLAVGAAGVLTVESAMGVMLWTAAPLVFYARP